MDESQIDEMLDELQLLRSEVRTVKYLLVLIGLFLAALAFPPIGLPVAMLGACIAVVAVFVGMFRK